MRKLIRLGALLALALGVLVGHASTASAKSVRCDEAGNCKVYCTQSLPNGTYVEYEEGTQIIVTTQDGKSYTFKCQNGQWVQQAIVVPSPPLLGNFGPTNIGPIQSDEIATVDLSHPVLSTFLRTVSRRPFSGGGCDPNTVGCPG